MTAPARSASGRELKRLLYFAAASALAHALTLGVRIPHGPASGVSPPPLTRALQATLTSTAERALADSPPLPDASASQPTSLERERQQPQPESGGKPDAARLPMPDRWYTAAEVEVRAQPLDDVEFAYPPKLERLVARVEVALFIDERGYVRKAQVVSAEPEKLFDEAALNGWRNVRFSPAMRGGVAVKSEKIVQVDFQPGLSR
jgi:TonB family protein